MFVLSPIFISVSYHGSFNRVKMSIFLYFKVLESIVFMRIIKNRYKIYNKRLLKAPYCFIRI